MVTDTEDCECALHLGQAVGGILLIVLAAFLISILPGKVREWKKRRREAREARIRMWERAYAKEAQRKSEASPFRRSE